MLILTVLRAALYFLHAFQGLVMLIQVNQARHQLLVINLHVLRVCVSSKIDF